MKACHGLVPVFDDDNLVSAAGLVPVLELAESAGLSAGVREVCTLPAANVAAKARTVVAGMLYCFHTARLAYKCISALLVPYASTAPSLELPSSPPRLPAPASSTSPPVGVA